MAKTDISHSIVMHAYASAYACITIECEMSVLAIDCSHNSSIVKDGSGPPLTHVFFPVFTCEFFT